jgi:hypothetical protein
MKTPAYIARTEVLCCASELIATLADNPLDNVLAGKARALFGIGGPGDRDALEHWIVSHWLAAKLIENAEIVDIDFAGLAVWGRITTGQAIECDEIIVAIAEESQA